MKITINSIALAIIILLLASCDRPPVLQEAQIAQSAPTFSLKDNQGITWNLANLKSKVTIVHFWATWCPPCRQEMPLLQEYFTSMKEEKIQILTIAYRDDPSAVKMFVKNAGWTMPVLFDPESNTGRNYSLTGVPETFIIDKNGLLRERFIGPVEWDDQKIRQRIMEYIKE
ncbi:MAG: TlpA family protein disulfide reductase [Desulfobulbaceae bacterium]|nr:TlpA family protein disulfide reductase [Desulfobulbaceae bacterium]